MSIKNCSLLIQFDAFTPPAIYEMEFLDTDKGEPLIKNGCSAASTGFGEDVL